jgi:hypothetical protein
VKNYVYILLFLFVFSGFFNPLKGAVSSDHNREYREIEPVQYDTITFQKFKNDRAFDYYGVDNEKVGEKSVFQRIFDALFDWYSKHLDKEVKVSEFNRILMIAGGIIGIILVIIFLIVTKSSLFYRNKKNRLNYLIEEDDLNRQDFVRLIDKALGNKQYAEAIRWAYLKTLKVLHDKEQISYDTFKTVNEYVYEITNIELRKSFKQLSLSFIYYRYGDGRADEDKFNDFKKLSEQVMRQIR